MDLWEAGQQRLEQERKDRLAEMFAAVGDALDHALVRVVQMVPKGELHAPRRPAYIEAARPTRPTGSPAARDATLLKLGVMFPGIVRTGAVQ